MLIPLNAVGTDHTYISFASFETVREIMIKFQPPFLLFFSQHALNLTASFLLLSHGPKCPDRYSFLSHPLSWSLSFFTRHSCHSPLFLFYSLFLRNFPSSSLPFIPSTLSPPPFPSPIDSSTIHQSDGRSVGGGAGERDLSR